MNAPSEAFDRIPIILQFPETPKFTETYGFAGTQGFVALEGQRFVPRAQPTSETVYLFMHPSSTLQLLPMPAALANAGLHVICAGSRYPKNDSALMPSSEGTRKAPAPALALTRPPARAAAGSPSRPK